MDPLTSPLQSVVGEVEGHVAEAGWDQPPQLFALVQTEQLLRAEPQLAQTMGLVAGDPASLTPVAQEPLTDAPLDQQLSSMIFGEEVLGVVPSARKRESMADSAASQIEALRGLAELYEKGVLTSEEFETQKARLLNQD